MTEEIVECPEGYGGLRVFYPVKGRVVIHGRYEGEGAGRTDEVVTVGEQAQVLGWIASWEHHVAICQRLQEIVLIQLRVVGADVYGHRRIAMLGAELPEGEA